MNITGGCLCKSVRYRISSAPIVTRVCWCRLCQYLGAGSGTVNTCFASDSITIEGAVAEYKGTADSGNLIRRRFCANCGTPLFSVADARPHLIFVRNGSLDDPEVGKPAMTIWTSAAPSWACMDPHLPKVERQPPPAG
jgi:hypothetical protein